MKTYIKPEVERIDFLNEEIADVSMGGEVGSGDEEEF